MHLILCDLFGGLLMTLHLSCYPEWTSACMFCMLVEHKYRILLDFLSVLAGGGPLSYYQVYIAKSSEFGYKNFAKYPAAGKEV